MPPLPPTRFYRLGALGEDWAEITCAQSSLSMALFLCSPHNILCVLHFIQMLFCLFPPLSYSYKCTNKSQAKTKRFVSEIKLWKSSLAVQIAFARKLWLGILSPQNPSSDNNDLGSRCAAVMCFVLQVLILQAFHALHPDLSQTNSGEHYDSV